MDVFGQGRDRPIVAENGGSLRRTPNGHSMPTPEPGSDANPIGPRGGAWIDEEGPPEVFTLWCFEFDSSQPAFDPPDEEWTGVFVVAARVIGGSTLILGGGVPTITEPFEGERLENPSEAGVRLAVAPTAPWTPISDRSARNPTGPGPDVWWIALFDPLNWPSPFSPSI